MENASYIWRVDPSIFEMVRKVVNDSPTKLSINIAITECVLLGLPLLCERYGITPVYPKLESRIPSIEDTLIKDKDRFNIFSKPDEIVKSQGIQVKEKDLS